MLQFTDTDDGFPKHSGSVGIRSIQFFASSHQIIFERCNIKETLANIWSFSLGLSNFPQVPVTFFFWGEGNLKGMMTAKCLNMPLSYAFRILKQPIWPLRNTKLRWQRSLSCSIRALVQFLNVNQDILVFSHLLLLSSIHTAFLGHVNPQLKVKAPLSYATQTQRTE